MKTREELVKDVTTAKADLGPALTAMNRADAAAGGAFCAAGSAEEVRYGIICDVFNNANLALDAYDLKNFRNTVRLLSYPIRAADWKAALEALDILRIPKKIGKPYLMQFEPKLRRITKEQQQAIKHLHHEQYEYEYAQEMTYLQFRRTVLHGDRLMVKYRGMWMFIEKDGYTNNHDLDLALPPAPYRKPALADQDIYDGPTQFAWSF